MEGTTSTYWSHSQKTMMESLLLAVAANRPVDQGVAPWSKAIGQPLLLFTSQHPLVHCQLPFGHATSCPGL